MMSLLNAAVTSVTLVITLMTLYLVVVTLAALWGRLKGGAVPDHQPSLRFKVLVPAHDEAELLPELIHSLNQLDYPKDLFEVHVVADNCTDDTAAIARSMACCVHERREEKLRGKGYALDWLMERMARQAPLPDAFVYVDADSRVSENMLRAIASRIKSGSRAVQVHYGVAAPEQSWGKGIRSAAMLLVNYVRPLGRTTIGGTAGLKGTGMAFVAPLAIQAKWGGALAEDAEFSLELLLWGEKVDFAPEAEVVAHVPASLADARQQNTRWEAGRVSIVAKFAAPVARMLLRERSFLAFDALLDMFIPPLSVLGLLVVVGLAAGLVSPVLGALALLNLLGLVVHVLAGLWIAGAKPVHYRALMGTPRFLAWKVMLYIPIVFGRRPGQWVRTERK